MGVLKLHLFWLERIISHICSLVTGYTDVLYFCGELGNKIQVPFVVRGRGLGILNGPEGFICLRVQLIPLLHLNRGEHLTMNLKKFISPRTVLHLQHPTVTT